MIRSAIFSFVFLFSLNAYTQVDTLAIARQLESFRSSDDHKEFWEEIYYKDQKYRGRNTVDSIDFLNLVKASMYLNKFGYPEEKVMGRTNKNIGYVWIHNSTPEVDRLTFPLIFQGYSNRLISEESLRIYYLRGLYNRKFNDEGNKVKPIRDLINQLDLEVSKKVSISKMLIAHQEEKDFLHRDHKNLGIWTTENTYDTLYYEGKPVISEVENDPIRIFQDSFGNYYVRKLYSDGSFYPRSIIRNGSRFSYFEDSKEYFEILDNGELFVLDRWGRRKTYILQKL